MASACLYGYFTGNSYAPPRMRRPQRSLPPPTPPVLPVTPAVSRSSQEVPEAPGVPEAPEVQDLRHLIDFRLSLAVECEEEGQRARALYHLERALFLEQELQHEQRVAAAG